MEFRWNDWNLNKIASHGVPQSAVEYVLKHARPPYPVERRDGKFTVWGATESGWLLQVVYVADPDDTVFVIHARPLTETEKHGWRRGRRRRGLR